MGRGVAWIRSELSCLNLQYEKMSFSEVAKYLNPLLEKADAIILLGFNAHWGNNFNDLAYELWAVEGNTVKLAWRKVEGKVDGNDQLEAKRKCLIDMFFSKFPPPTYPRPPCCVVEEVVIARE